MCARGNLAPEMMMIYVQPALILICIASGFTWVFNPWADRLSDPATWLERTISSPRLWLSLSFVSGFGGVVLSAFDLLHSPNPEADISLRQSIVELAQSPHHGVVEVVIAILATIFLTFAVWRYVSDDFESPLRRYFLRVAIVFSVLVGAADLCFFVVA